MFSPCSKCGEQSIKIEHDLRNMTIIPVCTICGHVGKEGFSLKDAKEKWNKESEDEKR